MNQYSGSVTFQLIRTKSRDIVKEGIELYDKLEAHPEVAPEIVLGLAAKGNLIAAAIKEWYVIPDFECRVSVTLWVKNSDGKLLEVKHITNRSDVAMVSVKFPIYSPSIEDYEPRLIRLIDKLSPYTHGSHLGTVRDFNCTFVKDYFRNNEDQSEHWRFCGDFCPHYYPHASCKRDFCKELYIRGKEGKTRQE